VTAVTLERLRREAVLDLVAAVPGGAAIQGAVLEQVVRRTDGVPLFVEELTKTVLELGVLEGGAADGAPAPAGAPPPAIPATLQDALMARLDRLGPVKEVAQLAAAAGREFPFELLQAAARLDQAALTEALERLVKGGLLSQRGHPPRATYAFKHVLVQETAYQALLRSRRRQYHRRIARVLAERFPATAATRPELLADHFSRAGLDAEAVPYWLRAGQLAIRRCRSRWGCRCSPPRATPPRKRRRPTPGPASCATW
jgi:predicted ATPase